MASTPVELHASATRTTSGVSASLDCDAYSTLRLTLDITANSEVGDGTPGAVRNSAPPVVKFELEESADNVTFTPFAIFGTGAALREERRSFAGFDRWIRVKWTLLQDNTPTTSVTFSLAGSAI